MTEKQSVSSILKNSIKNSLEKPFKYKTLIKQVSSRARRPLFENPVYFLNNSMIFNKQCFKCNLFRPSPVNNLNVKLSNALRMKKLSILLIACGSYSLASAQCAHDPLINESDTIICAGTSITLSTQTYDSYQWYLSYSSSSVGSPITGETSQTLTVNGFGWYTVEATVAGCAEFSNTVLVDEWVFLNPSVVHSSQTDFCDGDSTLIEITPGDWGAIQWLQNGSPITGATDSTFWVKQSGSYVVNASPSICPNIPLTSGIGPSFTFHAPVIPTATWNGTQLSSSAASTYQWNLNGTPIGSATNQTHIPALSGIYSVTTTDANGCEATSDTLHITIFVAGIGDKHNLPQPSLLYGVDYVEIDFSGSIDHVELIDMNGRMIQAQLRNNRLSFDGISKGIYALVIYSDSNVYRQKFVRH